MGPAARAYRLAFENAAPFSAERARLLERLAYLLAHHGWLHAADDSAAAAIEGFTLLHDKTSIGKTLITRGAMLRRMGNISTARALFLARLSYLPEEDWIYRTSAYHHLAWCELELGKLDEAQHYLTQSREAHQTKTGINWLKIPWLQSRIAIRQGDFAAAERYARIVVGGLDDNADPIDVARASLQLTHTLFLRQKTAEMVEVARTMMRLLTPLKHNEIASGLIAEFIMTVQAGRVTLRFLDRVSRSLEKMRATEDDARDIMAVEST